MDDVLKEELESIYVGVPGFYEAFFEEIPGLKSIAETVFKKCKRIIHYTTKSVADGAGPEVQKEERCRRGSPNGLSYF
jgi:hypothetical protein